MDDEDTQTSIGEETDTGQEAQGRQKRPVTDEQREAKNKAARDKRAARKAAGNTDNAAAAAGGKDVAQTKRKAKKAGKKGAKKGAIAPKRKAASNGNAGPRGKKTKEIARLLQRKTGCTAVEVKAMTGWPAVSMPAMSKACGLRLRKEKVEGKEGVRAHTRYFGTPA